jgi:uncharacterized protein YggE
MLRLIVASGLAVTALAACDSHPGPAANAHQVTVTGAGHVQGVPDTLTADIGIEFTAPVVTAAMDQTSQRQQAVIDALTGAGVDSKDITTIDVTVQPQYDGNSGTVIGYRATNSIRVKVRKTDAAPQLLAVVVSTGGDATRISSVSYSIDDDSKLVKDARGRAFQDAKDRAGQYAQLAGLHLGKLISISEAPVNAPAPRAPTATEVPLQPGRQTVSFSATTVWELR